MKDLDLPLTPDFDPWPITAEITEAVVLADGNLRLIWSDATSATYHRLLLAENSTDPETLHQLSRETVLSPLDFPEGLAITQAHTLPSGALALSFSDGVARGPYHPGWLHAHGFNDQPIAAPAPILWRAEDQPDPPSFDGPEALKDPAIFYAWLCALRDYGVARLRNLPNRDGLLEEVLDKIGTIRPTNFGRMFTLEIQDDPTSNAYTSHALPPHMDLCTRECPPGLQFLFCRANTTTGGAGLYTDAYRVAEDIRAQDPDLFATLCEVEWSYNNRAKGTSYKASGPMVNLDASGQIASVRYETWLRAPLVADLETQERAYTAYRAFAVCAADLRYCMEVRYEAGDLFAFDNRRALHGRSAYDAAGGARFIEGVYSDRDDLHSAIRVLERAL